MWREEFSKDKFKWQYEHPQDFVICFWQKNQKVSKLWIAYRVFIVLYFSISIFVVIILRATEDAPWYKNPIFIYYWVGFTEIATFALGLVISVQRYKQEKKDPELPPLEKMPFLYKAMWMTYTTAAPCAAGITTIFILFIYGAAHYAYLRYAILTQVCNTVCFLIDYSVCAVPFRLLHFYMPVSLAITYALFTYIYQTSGGTGNQGKIPINKMIDWRTPEAPLKTYVVYVVYILVAHVVYWTLHMGKHWVRRRRQENLEEL